MKIQDYAICAAIIIATSLIINFDAAKFLNKNTVKQSIVSQSANSKELQKVQTEYNKIESESDKILIYKLFSGASEYLSVAKSLESTSQFDPIIGKVQTSYGWNREKYPDFTTAVSDYLVSVKYDEPKPLSSDEDRKRFAEIFKDLSEAIK